MKVVFYGLIIAGLCLSTTGCSSPRANADAVPAKAVDPFDPERPPMAKTLYVMADILASQGREVESIRVLERTISEHPEFMPAYNRLAELQMRRRSIPDAIDTLTKGLEVNAEDPVLLNNLGMCHLIRKDYEKALDYFTRAMERAPEKKRYRSNTATALVLLDRRQEALTLYEQILPKEEAAENIEILCDSIQ